MNELHSDYAKYRNIPQGCCPILSLRPPELLPGSGLRAWSRCLLRMYLSTSFANLLSTDPSPRIIAPGLIMNGHPNGTFRELYTDNIPFIPNGGVDMLVAGQAAHCFDSPMLFPGMHRILRNIGTLAFGVTQI